MPDLAGMSHEELVQYARANYGDASVQAEFSRRLIVALDASSATISRLTRWLIGFTIALVVIGAATLAVTIWD